MLATIPPELYVRILQRLDSTDDALQSFDTPIARYGQSLRTKYKQYDEQVRAYEEDCYAARNTAHELQAAIGRPKAYKGIENETYNEIAEDFARFYNSSPTRVATALTLLFEDPALELNFLPETRSLELCTAGFEQHTRTRRRCKMAFVLTSDQLQIELTMQMHTPLITDCQLITRDSKLTFANKTQAVADVISAIKTSNLKKERYQKIALKYLLLGSSLFSRNLRLHIDVILSLTPNNTDYFKQTIAELRQLSFVCRRRRGYCTTSYEFELDPGSEAAAQPFCDNLDQLPDVQVRTYNDYCQYRLR